MLYHQFKTWSICLNRSTRTVKWTLFGLSKRRKVAMASRTGTKMILIIAKLSPPLFWTFVRKWRIPQTLAHQHCLPHQLWTVTNQQITPHLSSVVKIHSWNALCAMCMSVWKPRRVQPVSLVHFIIMMMSTMDLEWKIVLSCTMFSHQNFTQIGHTWKDWCCSIRMTWIK